MTDESSRDDRWQRPAAEGIGTFFLVLIGPGAAAVDRFLGTGAIGTTGIALAFFFAILLAVVSLASISGAHINPAVTIGLWSVGRFDGRRVASYIGAQCFGAVLAALVIRAVVGGAAAAAATTPSISVGAAFLVEFVFSAVLMWVIISAATDERIPPALGPLAIAATVGGLALQGGLTGSSMNPARSFGPAVATVTWSAHWIYWVAPIAGMTLAARLHALVVRPRARRPAFETSEPAAAD
jgi:MIP family channel proteins